MPKRPKYSRCPECGSQSMYANRADVVEYKGHKKTVRVSGYWCMQCDEAIFEGPALKKYEDAYFGLKAEVDGVFSPCDVKKVREKLNLSQRRASELLGGGPHSFQKYESGEQQVSVPMTNLLRLLSNDPSRLNELVKSSSRSSARQSKHA